MTSLRCADGGGSGTDVIGLLGTTAFTFTRRA